MTAKRIWISAVVLAIAAVALGFYADWKLEDLRRNHVERAEDRALRAGVGILRDWLELIQEELVVAAGDPSLASAGDVISVDGHERPRGLPAPQLVGARRLLVCSGDSNIPIVRLGNVLGREGPDCSWVSPSSRSWSQHRENVGSVQLDGLVSERERSWAVFVTPSPTPERFVASIVDVSLLGSRMIGRLGLDAANLGFLRFNQQLVAAYPRVESFSLTSISDPDSLFLESFSGNVQMGVRLSGRAEEQALVSWRSVAFEEERWVLGTITPLSSVRSTGLYGRYAGLLVGLALAVLGIAAGRLFRSRERLFQAFAREQQRAREVGDQAWQNALLGQLVEDLRLSMNESSIYETAVGATVAALRASRALVYSKSEDGLYRLTCQVVSAGVSPLEPSSMLPSTLHPERDTSRFSETDLSDDADPELRAIARRLNLRSLVVAPISRAEGHAGVLAIHSCDEARVWSGAEQRLVQRVADRIGTALDQASLYQDQAAAADVRSALLRMAHALSSQRTSQAVLKLAASIAPTIRRIERCSILLLDGPGKWYVASQDGYDREDSPALTQLRADPVISRLFTELERGAGSVSVARSSFAPMPGAEDSALPGELTILPLVYGSETMGAFVFETSDLSMADGGELEAARIITELTASALKNAQLFEALKASETKYVDLYDNAPDMYSTIDLDGKVLDCNRTQCLLLRRERRELVGTSLANLMDDDSLLQWARLQKRLFRDGAVRDASLTIETEDARRIDVFLSAVVMRDDTDRVVGARVVMRDISEVKELELQLQHSQKQEVLGTLVGGVAHDFNNILGGIMGHASLLRVQLEEASLVSRHLETIERSAVRGAELTSRLLDATRKTPARRAPTDLNLIVEETLDLLERTFPGNLHLQKRFDPLMRALLADPSQIQQVVMNLCVNARDAMPNGGRLAIETEVMAVENRIRLTVEDSGVGMDPATLERLFEPYFTTKGDRGSGLGLSVVYGIVKSYGGDIQVNSSPGKGARFDVWLPMETSSALPELERSAGLEETRGSGELVLIVDDDEILLAAGRRSLELSGYRVVTAPGGDAAVQRLTELGGEIKLVILDLVMPGIDGFETLQRIRELDSEIPVLLTSGATPAPNPGRLARFGSAGFVPKPYGARELARLVSRFLGGESSSNRVH